jgi:hypothetical protein
LTHLISPLSHQSLPDFQLTTIGEKRIHDEDFAVVIWLRVPHCLRQKMFFSPLNEYQIKLLVELDAQLSIRFSNRQF